LGIGDWATPQSPIPNPQSPLEIYNKFFNFFKELFYKIILNCKKFLKLF